MCHQCCLSSVQSLASSSRRIWEKWDPLCIRLLPWELTYRWNGPTFESQTVLLPLVTDQRSPWAPSAWAGEEAPGWSFHSDPGEALSTQAPTPCSTGSCQCLGLKQPPECPWDSGNQDATPTQASRTSCIVCGARHRTKIWIPCLKFVMNFEMARAEHDTKRPCGTATSYL